MDYTRIDCCTACGKEDFLLFACPNSTCSDGKFCAGHRFNHPPCDASTSHEDRPGIIPEKKLSTAPLVFCSFEEECNPKIQLFAFNSVRCKDCHRSFCLPHRHKLDSHLCTSSALTNAAGKEKADALMGKSQQIILDRLSLKASSSTGKLKKPNPRLDLMKLKLSAKGNDSIPMEKRIYLSVHFTAASGKDGKPDEVKSLFFKDDTTVGRLIDLLAKMVGWPNNNNNTASPTGLKDILRLESMDGVVLEPSLSLKEIIAQSTRVDKSIYNGGSIRLTKREEG